MSFSIAVALKMLHVEILEIGLRKLLFCCTKSCCYAAGSSSGVLPQKVKNNVFILCILLVRFEKPHVNHPLDFHWEISFPLLEAVAMNLIKLAQCYMLQSPLQGCQHFCTWPDCQLTTPLEKHKGIFPVSIFHYLSLSCSWASNSVRSKLIEA